MIGTPSYTTVFFSLRSSPGCNQRFIRTHRRQCDIRAKGYGLRQPRAIDTVASIARSQNVSASRAGFVETRYEPKSGHTRRREVRMVGIRLKRRENLKLDAAIV